MFKKNTAVTGFTVGLISSTDGSDITTGTPVGYYTLDGGTQTAIADVTPVHEGNGQWSFDLTAGEMNGDIVGLVFTHPSAITVHFTIKTDTKIVSELNDFNSATDTVATVTTLTNLPAITSNWLTAAGIAAGALDGKGDWNTTTPPTAASIRTEIDTNSTQLAAIVADTNELQTDDVPGLIAGLNDLSAADVNAQVDTALADIHLDHLLAVDYNPASKPGVATALLNELVESDAGVSRFTVNALENGPSGSGASAAAIADAVWDEAQADHTTAGSMGESLNDASSGGGGGDATAANQTTIINHLTDIKGATWDSTNSLEAIHDDVSVVDTVVDGIQTDLDNGTDGLGAIKTAVDAVPTSTANADALLNRDMSAVTDSNSRTPLNAFRFLRNKWEVSGTTLTVNKEDDSTSAWTATVTTNASADPITGNDPA